MKLNRRQLLGSAAAVAATAAAPAAMAAVKEEKTDLVIVGGGLGGLCAAYAAVRKGVKPIVLEKAPVPGRRGPLPRRVARRQHALHEGAWHQDDRSAGA